MLAQVKDVPADATVVIIAGPTTDLLQPEVDMLQRFLKKGGHAARADRSAGRQDRRRPSRTRCCKDWDFQAGNDVVVDAQRRSVN